MSFGSGEPSVLIQRALGDLVRAPLTEIQTVDQVMAETLRHRRPMTIS
jgi:hypothetical protein